MENKETILRVENIHKSFGDLEVLKGVSFDVTKGETICFIGPSGTGKSTLLRCINLLTQPDQGSVWLGDREVTNSGKNINHFRQRIGMVFQNFFLFDHLTAVRNVEIALIKVKGMKNINKKHVKRIIERVFFPHRFSDEIEHNKTVVEKRYSLDSLKYKH